MLALLCGLRRGELVGLRYGQTETTNVVANYRGVPVLPGSMGLPTPGYVVDVRDDGGYFWFEGRADDVITSSAYRIGPFEVESVLLEHPAAVEAAVVGRATRAPTKDPRLIRFVPERPKTASGKICRSELKARLNAGEFD